MSRGFVARRRGTKCALNCETKSTHAGRVDAGTWRGEKRRLVARAEGAARGGELQRALEAPRAQRLREGPAWRVAREAWGRRSEAILGGASARSARRPRA